MKSHMKNTKKTYRVEKDEPLYLEIEANSPEEAYAIAEGLSYERWERGFPYDDTQVYTKDAQGNWEEVRYR